MKITYVDANYFPERRYTRTKTLLSLVALAVIAAALLWWIMHLPNLH